MSFKSVQAFVFTARLFLQGLMYLVSETCMPGGNLCTDDNEQTASHVCVLVAMQKVKDFWFQVSTRPHISDQLPICKMTGSCPNCLMDGRYLDAWRHRKAHVTSRDNHANDKGFTELSSPIQQHLHSSQALFHVKDSIASGGPTTLRNKLQDVMSSSIELSFG